MTRREIVARALSPFVQREVETIIVVREVCVVVSLSTSRKCVVDERCRGVESDLFDYRTVCLA